MNSEITSKKRKIVPDDEFVTSKKIKQTTSNVVPKKRKAAIEKEPIITKKSKALKLPDHKTSGPIPTEKSSIGDLNSKARSTTTKKLKSTQDVATTKKQVMYLEERSGTKDRHSQSHKMKDHKLDKTVSVSDNESGDLSADSEEDEVDDQTAALLKGLESEDDVDKYPQDNGYEMGQKIPQLDNKTKKQAKTAGEASASNSPGVIYVGRIPHGFYEQEMKQYFSQFGDISNLRLSRNRKTGRSKHFAFIEFKSAEVAEIVAKTMDNYLLFGHILKCKPVAREQVHPNLWEGANKRFKKVPWNKMEGRRLNQGMTEEAWNKRVEREEERRVKKKEILKSIGYEFESPAVKSANGVAKKTQTTLFGDANNDTSQEEIRTIEALKLDDEHVPANEGPRPIERNSKKENKLGLENSVQMILDDASKAQDLPAVDDALSRRGKSEKNKKKRSRNEQDGAVVVEEVAPGKHIDTLRGKKFTEAGKMKKGTIV